MALIKLGELINQSDSRNENGTYGEEAVVGISTAKELIRTKADLNGVSLLSYKLLFPGYFAYVPDTSRRGDKIALAYNKSNETYLISSIYTVFSVDGTEKLLPDYLFIYFNRPEFDRYSRYNSWGSAREVFSWNDFCDIEVDLPDISVQQKFVDIYKSMVANQKSYEGGLTDLKLTCDAFVEELLKQYKKQSIGEYIELVEEKNSNCQFGLDDVRGISIEKKLIETKADMKDVNLEPYSIIRPDCFAYVTVTSRNGEKISIALNDSDKSYICSSSYIVFKCKDENVLLPQYLMLFFSRKEFDRYARFNSFGSARETFDWQDMCEVKIPIPDISLQRSITEVYTAYNARKRLNEQLKEDIRNICPVLIRGSLNYGG